MARSPLDSSLWHRKVERFDMRTGTGLENRPQENVQETDGFLLF